MAIPKLILRNNPAYKESSLLGYQPLANNKIAPIPFSFTRASAGSVEKAAGIVEMPSNFPRIDADGSLLLEPARTNLLTYSNDFSNAAWAKIAGGTGIAPIVTPNAGISPDGTNNADRIEFDAVGTTSVDRSILRQSVSPLTTEGTTTFYVKSADGNTYYISGQTGVTIGDFEVTNEWKRISFSNTITGQTLCGLEVRGDRTTGGYANILVYGGQLEDVNTYPTSYIPTSGATATRVEDNSTKNDLITSGFLGATEGAMFIVLDAEELFRDSTATLLLLGSSNGRIQIFNNADSKDYPVLRVQSTDTTLNDYQLTQRNNLIVFNWSANNVDFWVNGAKVVSTNKAFSLTNETLTLRGSNRKANINELTLFDVALTDQECINLTK